MVSKNPRAIEIAISDGDIGEKIYRLEMHARRWFVNELPPLTLRFKRTVQRRAI